MSEDCLVTQKSSGNASTAPPEIDNEDTGIKALLKELNQSAYEFTRPIKNNSGFVAECNNSSHTPTNAPSDEKQIVANINDDEDLMEYIREQLEYETCDLDHIVFELSSLIPTTFEANELNLLIHQYFDRTRSPGPDEERLDFAISIQELGVLFICDENSEKFRLLSNLGYSYKCRFKAHGQLDDIEQAIWNETQAVLLAGVDHMDLPVLLGNLGTSRWCRFERLGDAKDIEEAIKCQTQAVSLVPDDHPNIHTLLNNLGNSYHSRFESTGEPPDINMSIDCHRRAVSFALEEDEIWSARLNLGNSYCTRFESFGNIEDIEETISLQAQTVLIMTDDDPRKAEGLSNLGNSYWSRFKRIGRFEDINRAITYQKSATTLAPGGHFEQPPRLYYLGRSYGSCFERTGSLGDIEDAIACQSQAVELTPEGHSVMT